MLEGVEETLVDFYIPGITYILKKKKTFSIHCN